ncbi:hypothetical protein ACFUJR_17250 [Streptomyces sp. NPDC057271]
MGDEEHAHAALAAQPREDCDDLGLGGHVQSGGQLVGGQRRRDHHVS